MDDLGVALKPMIVDAPAMEKSLPETTGSEEPLFVCGLGLDFIDAIQLGVALPIRYGIRIDFVTREANAHVANVGSLAQFVRPQQEAQQ